MTNLLAPTLIMIRHAHRSKSFGPETDNGISSKGRKQALALARFFRKRFKKGVPIIYSSPKKRCVQTVAPIAKLTKAKVHILPCLDESAHSEDLRGKLREFGRIRRESESELMVICSHGDWIPAYFRAELGLRIELSKGGWAELEFHGDRPSLTWLIQSLTAA